MNSGQKYRLLTRSDFDGLVCAILLKSMGMLESIHFVHPKDVQDGKIEITDRDILTNLPYAAGCHLCFDHHDSEASRGGGAFRANHILLPDADSAARVLYDWYGGAKAFPAISDEMMEAVDKADSARFSRSDILDPQGWELLSFLMDPRTGLGRFRQFRMSNYDLMMALIDHCAAHPIGETLALPDVRERLDLYREHERQFAAQLFRCATVHGDVAVLDLREEEVIYVGNRFMIYALFPQCTLSMHVLWGLRKEKTVLALGKSILDRGCQTNVGELMLRYGGGGHEAAGTCQVENDFAQTAITEIVDCVNTEAAVLKELLLV
jgi:nanoRNase/pAp phosphatase (c-di-AMP/oligoRNAs hydrolase)